MAKQTTWTVAAGAVGLGLGYWLGKKKAATSPAGQIYGQWRGAWAGPQPPVSVYWTYALPVPYDPVVWVTARDPFGRLIYVRR